MGIKKGDIRGSRTWKALRLRILAAAGYTCFYCGHDATTVDHVVPVSKTDLTGAIDENNLVACCVRCNSAKGSRSQAVFLARSATPPAFSVRPSPKTLSTVHNGSCVGQNPQDVNGK